MVARAFGALWAALSIFGCGKSFDALENLDAEERRALDRLLADAGLEGADLTKKDGNVSVSLVNGHVNRLVLDGPPKRVSLGALGAFGSLEALELSRAADLDGLPEDCSLLELRLASNGIADLSPLSRCASLERLWIVDEKLDALTTLPELPKLTALYVHEVSLKSLDGVGGRPTLETLLVTHAGLESLTGLENLPSLKTLDLSDNALTDAAALDALPKLEEVDVANNALSTFPKVVMAADIPKISGNPGASATREALFDARLEADAERRRAERKLDFDVPLPKVRGSMRRASKQISWSGSAVEGEGSIGLLTGVSMVQLRTFSPTDISDDAAKRPAERRMEFSVREGSLRVFFGRGPGRVPSILVEPGKPRVVRTNLVPGDRWVGFFVQAVGGEAKGIRYTLAD